MKQLASASVVCEAAEGNRKILMRALYKELGLTDKDVMQSGCDEEGHWFLFKRGDFGCRYLVKIVVNELPDKKGFCFCAQGDHLLFEQSKDPVGIGCMVFSMLYSLFVLGPLTFVLYNMSGSMLIAFLCLILFAILNAGIHFVLYIPCCKAMFKRRLQAAFDHFAMLYGRGIFFSV